MSTGIYRHSTLLVQVREARLSCKKVPVLFILTELPHTLEMATRVGTILNAPRSRPTNLKTSRECLNMADHDREPCPTLPVSLRLHLARSLADATLVQYL